MLKACGTPAPRRAAARHTARAGNRQPRPRAPPGGGGFSGPQEGGDPAAAVLHGVVPPPSAAAAPRPRQPRGLRDPQPRAGRWARSGEPAAVPPAGEGRRERPGPENTPAGTRAARGSWQRAPGPGSAALFYPARNHLVYRKYLFALLVGTGVNYSTCERGVIWIKAAPVFIVWVSC